MVRARGGNDFDADGVYPQGFLDEHNQPEHSFEVVGSEVIRVSTGDDVIPLSKPVIGAPGKVYNGFPIHAGTPITISLLGYNMYVTTHDHCFLFNQFLRNRDVLGPDADVLRPECRFEMNEKLETTLGVFWSL